MPRELYGEPTQRVSVSLPVSLLAALHVEARATDSSLGQVIVRHCRVAQRNSERVSAAKQRDVEPRWKS